MDLKQDLKKNNFLLLLVNEQGYDEKVKEIAESLKKGHKMAHVCLSRPYTDVIAEMDMYEKNKSKFFFIDALSSHYQKPKPEKNCIFIDGPAELCKIKEAIKYAIRKKKCDIVIFDSVSTLLMYTNDFSILRFTHNLMSQKVSSTLKTLYLFLRMGFGDDGETLIKDLSMFADRTINISLS